MSAKSAKNGEEKETQKAARRLKLDQFKKAKEQKRKEDLGKP